MIGIISSIFLLAVLRGRLSYPTIELLIEFMFAELLLLGIIFMFGIRLYKNDDWKSFILLVNVVCIALFSAMTRKKSAWRELGRLNVFMKDCLYSLFVIEFSASVITGAMIFFNLAKYIPEQEA